MFDNIGKKIKTLAKVTAIVGIVCSFVTGLFMIMNYYFHEELLLEGILVIVLGSLGSWIGCFVLYGYGEKVDKICEIERHVRGVSPAAKEEDKSDKKYDEALAKLDNLYIRNVITHEDYICAIKRIKAQKEAERGENDE